MCIYDEMSAFQPSVNTMPEQYEVRFCKADSSVSAETFSNKSSVDATCSPPTYDSAEPFSLPVNSSVKKNIFARIFSRNKKSAHKQESLPSYRETEIAEAWAKVGIDVNDRKQGPRPHCTPDELVNAMDGLFGSTTQSKPKRRAGEAVVVHAFPGSRTF
ncbi:hypothetical protein NDA18_002980 [Ustilago nuda]|nr:hypothetical protein NDA18_002980 [Ustilago nuda]